MTATQPPARVLIGGVGYRWHGDGSFGLVASDALAQESWPEHVRVDDLGYGALYVALDLADAIPRYDRVVLLGGVARGRRPGVLYTEYGSPQAMDDEDLQARIREAGAGVLDMDHLSIIARHFGGLPDDVIRIELEPADVGCGDALSPEGAGCLPEALALARREALAPPARAAR
jgi:hydrogenase maturation protease